MTCPDRATGWPYSSPRAVSRTLRVARAQYRGRAQSMLQLLSRPVPANKREFACGSVDFRLAPLFLGCFYLNSALRQCYAVPLRIPEVPHTSEPDMANLTLNRLDAIARALGTPSCTSGSPLELENRMTVGTVWPCMCAARVTARACGAARKVPEQTMPLA
jgi:hypothetical protein